MFGGKIFFKGFKDNCLKISEFPHRIDDNKIILKRLEYLSLMIHYVSMSSIIIYEDKEDEDNKFISYVDKSTDENEIISFLKEAANAVSLSGPEYEFLNNIIDIKWSEDIIDNYIKLFNTTERLKNCTYGGFFQEVLDETKNNIKIIT